MHKHDLKVTKSQEINVHSTVQGGSNSKPQYSIHLSSSNIRRLSKFFYCHILQEIFNRAIIKYFILPQSIGSNVLLHYLVKYRWQTTN